MQLQKEAIRMMGFRQSSPQGLTVVMVYTKQRAMTGVALIYNPPIRILPTFGRGSMLPVNFIRC